MKKYIDAEKLKAEIERLKQPFKKDIEDGVYPTYLCALLDFDELIDSLHQEQPKKIVQPTVSIKGWVAKDYNGTVRLFFLCKPQRIDDKRYKYWYGGSNASKQLSNDSFSNLKWEDEPIEVELIINKL